MVVETELLEASATSEPEVVAAEEENFEVVDNPDELFEDLESNDLE